jgi:hypothetical protein
MRTTFKVTIHDNYFVVKKYDTNDELAIIQKTSSYTCDWMSYSPLTGLFLDNICVGINLFNLDAESYTNVQKISLPTLFNVLRQNNLDQIEQVTSDQRIKIIDGIQHVNGTNKIHCISNTNPNGSTYMCGAFGDLTKYCPNTKLPGLTKINLDMTFEEGSKCVISNTDENISYKYTYSSST